MKTILGCTEYATAKSARTSFSPSPTHFDVSELAEIAKNRAFASVATAFASSVFPVPGGPKSKIPFGGARKPWKISGFSRGKITAS
mmetsp:Transcript_23713/g.59788  ORF Transcript_23713/g.59788 Transcript_23713/m.59788 type:complete len:86 (-) Transcript_23713:680-937(-)